MPAPKATSAWPIFFPFFFNRFEIYPSFFYAFSPPTHTHNHTWKPLTASKNSKAMPCAFICDSTLRRRESDLGREMTHTGRGPDARTS